MVSSLRSAAPSSSRYHEAGGAKLVEVEPQTGHYEDYADAVSSKTGALMKVHTSNYTVQGFTKEVSGRELSKLSREKDLPSLRIWVAARLRISQLMAYRTNLLHRKPSRMASMWLHFRVINFWGGHRRASLLGGRI